MNDIVIYGSGGFAREIAHLIEDINEKDPQWNLLGFIDDDVESHGSVINELPVLGGIEWFNDRDLTSVVMGIGSPNAKEKIISNLRNLSNVDFPNLIHPSVKFSRFNNIGQGNVICEGNILTTNIVVKDFVTINLNCTIGHDTIISSYCTILPNSSISGNVLFEEKVDFGTNATIIQGIKVGCGTIVGAAAVVVKDLPANCTAVGMPAKPIKFHEGSRNDFLNI
ncbi:acetyltransferase [Sporosarcina luteola]|uniref:acetyltransferase n=1 Tax=Sporosarcina luteola TaxID=582850 RepID=UPI00203E1A05|nr:acetyltransferase [Sporosarcina luteola]MCM3636549.1 acetyltransferase [Sporosarcina luteola]